MRIGKYRLLKCDVQSGKSRQLSPSRICDIFRCTLRMRAAHWCDTGSVLTGFLVRVTQPSGYYMYSTTSFNIQKFYVLSTVYWCVLCGSENKQRLFPYTALTAFYNWDRLCLLRGTDWVFIYNSTFCPHTVFMCFVWIWEQTAIVSLYNIKWLVFITETECLLRGTDWIFIIIHSTHRVHLCVLCGSENKQRLFPYTALIGWFL